jgi:hypothetical protein
MMENEFYMSMMGELTFFLGIQVKQMKQGTFVHQAKYTKDLIKKFNMAELKPMSTPMSMQQQCWIRMKMAKQLIKGSIGASLAPSCTSQRCGGTFGLRCACVHAFNLLHGIHIGKPFSGSLVISNTHLNLGFSSLLLLHLILLGFLMLILRVVELIEKTLLVHVIFLDLLLFVGLLANNLLLLSQLQRSSM